MAGTRGVPTFLTFLKEKYMKKILFIVMDGLGDEPIPAFGGQTPLEAAQTPNLDLMAQKGTCGLLEIEAQGAMPTSEGGHFSLFGYDPVAYKIRRGIITATGAGIKAKKGDVALRGNLATVDEELNMVDRRAGRIKDADDLIRALNRIEVGGVKFIVKSATEHRLGIVMRGHGLSYNISDGDSHYGELGTKAMRIRPLDNSHEAAYTAQALNEFLSKAHQVLKNHSHNKEREGQGLPPANYILTRGASSLPELPPFKKKYGLKAACISGKPLYQQIGRILGMKVLEVKGATGKANTNLLAKFKAAKQALKRYDFVFLHIKATDSLAEDGDYEGKREFIEKVDQHMDLTEELKDSLVVVTCDHSTCSVKKRHCSLPCPILVFGNGRDNVVAFSEKLCWQGGLGTIKQVDLMENLVVLAK